MTEQQKPVMTPKHRRWQEFVLRMEGPDGCDFQEVDGQYVWTCDATAARPAARRLLEAMGFDVEASLAYFSEHGGHCDCEILYNVEADASHYATAAMAAMLQRYQ